MKFPYYLLDNFPPPVLESYALNDRNGQREALSTVQQLRYPIYPSDMPSPGIGPDKGL
jgi:hypothetical protein